MLQRGLKTADLFRAEVLPRNRRGLEGGIDSIRVLRIFLMVFVRPSYL